MDTRITMAGPEYPIEHNNFLVHRVPKKKRVKIPKSLIMFFLVLQLCFGIDTGFSQMFGGKERKIIQKLSLISALTISTILISPLTIWYREVCTWCTLIKYTINFFNFKLIKYKIYDFLKNVHDLNERIPAIDRNIFGIVMLVYTLTMFILKGILLTIRCSSGQSNYCNIGIGFVSATYYTIFSLCCLSTDSISGVLFVVVYYVYSYVKHMKNCLEKDFDLKAFESRYIVIAQCCTKIKQMFNHIIIVELFTNTPRIMWTLWSMLVYIKENAAWYAYTSEWTFAFHLSIQMCVPSVIGEMVNSQMDSIKLILNERRIIEKDKEKSEEITRILRYIKVRRLQNEIWRVIPVDLRLPLALLSICTTYFIVILQFTHLYD